MKPSTRSFGEESRRTPGLSLLDRMHGYFYGRWPYLYIDIGTVYHPLNRIFGHPLRWLARVWCVRLQVPPGGAFSPA
jgi:hypothetical protein